MTDTPTNRALGSRLRAILWKRSIPMDIFQGALIGFGLSILIIGSLISVRSASLTSIFHRAASGRFDGLRITVWD